jgi:hypothetical protein
MRQRLEELYKENDNPTLSMIEQAEKKLFAMR